MSKKIGIVCAIVIVLASMFCLYQFTDIFGAKQGKLVAMEATPAIAEEPAAAEAPVEEAAPEEKDENPVLATVDGAEIRQADVEKMLQTLVSGGYMTDSKDYKTALDYMIQTKMLSAEISKLGFDQFTDGEKAQFAVDAKAEWENAIQQYVDYFGGDDVEQTRQEGALFYASRGISEETIMKQLQSEASQAKLEAYLLEGKDVAVTPEEIRAVFEQYARQDMESFDGSIGTYELYQAYYGQTFWFVPEGYRGIIHILLDVEEDLMDAYSQAQAAYEETVSEETPEGDANLKAAMDAAQAAVLDSRKDVIDDIYARLANGESFTALIEEYNQDPGMKDAKNLQNGYQVHQESLIWDPVFTEAAFSEKMVKPGDVSDPVVGKNGIHILFYLRDVPAGMVELTDAISNEIETYLDNTKKNEVFMAAIADWTAQHDIVYNQEAIYALTNEAQ